MLSKIKMNKKGDATDIIFFAIIFFFLAVSFVVVIYVNTKVADVISNTPLNQSSAYPDIITGINNINQTVTQRGYVLMFGLFIIGLMVSAFMVRVHPIFIFIYIFTLVFTIILSVYLSNLYQAIIENAQFATILTYYPMITWIMQHAIAIMIGVGALSMIVTFAKLSGASPSSGGDL